MAPQRDPYAATAEAAPDPYAGTAEGSTATAAASTKTETAPAKTGPLDSLAEWGAKKFPYLSPEALRNSPEFQKYDTIRKHPVIGPPIARFAGNAVNATARNLLATPAGVVDWLWKNGIKGPLTPAQSAQRMHEEAQGGKRFDPKTPITPDLVSDYASDLAGKVAAGYIEAEAGGLAHRAVKAVTPESLRLKSQKLMGSGERPVTAAAKEAGSTFTEGATEAKTHNAALEEQRTRRREIETRTDQKTTALTAKQKTIQAAATAENKARWDSLRAEMGDEHTTSAEPLQIAAEAAIQAADPATSPLFKRILKHNPGEEAVPGTLNAGTPRDWEEYQARQEAHPDLDEAPPAMDEGGVTFNRLQRWRGYLNHKLFGGGRLEGGTYHAYQTMLRGIDAAMDDIAQKTGQTDALKEARAGHQHLMETFSDSPNIPMTAAKQNLQRTNPEAFREQHDREMESRVAHYDPSYATDAAAVRKDRETMKKFPTEDSLEGSLAEPPDMPSMGLDEARRAKLGGLEKRIEWIHRRGMWIATGAAFAGTLYGALQGNFSTITRAVIESSAAAAVAGRYVEFLEKPGIQEWLTRPDPMSLREWQKLRPEQQAVVSEALRPTVETARTKGIKIAPTVLVMAGLTANPPQTAGEAKERVQETQQVSAP